MKHEDGTYEVKCPECGKEHVRVYYEGGRPHLELHKVWANEVGKGPYAYCIPAPRDEEI